MRGLSLVLLLCGVTPVAASAQHTTLNKTAAATPPKARTDTLTPASLHTDTLNYGDDLKRIYVGDFAHVTLKRDGTEFGVVVGGYMTQYSYSCAQYLPRGKVEIMTQECSQEQYTVNGYGVEQAGSRHCASYRTVGTGRYADPQVYALQKTLDAQMAAGMLGELLGSLTQKGADPTSGMKRTTDVVVYVKQDMDHFLEENACNAPATRRFQENMLRFGRNEEPIKMAGGAEAVASSAVLAKGQNYKRLVDDLITEESRAWMLNRYQPGSVQVNAVQHDSGGKPREIDAGYSSIALVSTAVSQVRVTFANGAPECLYFSDFPSTCRAPSPRMLSSYKRNVYADENAPTYPETPPEPARTIRPMPSGTTSMASNVGPRQAAMRPNQPFTLSVRTLDLINEASASSPEAIRARLDRAVLLKDAELAQGITVYLNVALNRSGNANSYMDMYNITVSKVVANGKTIAVNSSPVRITRRGSAQTAFRQQSDLSAIPVGTFLNFTCTETTTQ